MRQARTPSLIAVSFALFVLPALSQEEGRNRREKADIDKLHELVRQVRAELQTLRAQAGIPTEEGERHREGRGEHGEGRREGRGEHGEGGRGGRGEHGGRGESGPGEEGGKRVGRNERWDETRSGARLILAYDSASQSFKGIVHNTTSKTLADVRVEVHLSNGIELGPTRRTNLKPGAKMAVELSAANQKFSWWTTHPEHGSEEGHGPGHEGEGAGEHGEVGGGRPMDPDLRPLYNQLQLLRRDIKVLSEDLRRKGR